MNNVRRVYVEKKEAFAGAAKDLTHEIRSYLGVERLKKIRILIRYDVEHISDQVFAAACKTVFAEPPVDILYQENFPMGDQLTALFLWNTFRDSLTREQIPQYSV